MLDEQPIDESELPGNAELVDDGPKGAIMSEYRTCGDESCHCMSGGIAYVLDESGEFERRTNMGMVTLSHELGERDKRMLRRLVENHAAYYRQRARGPCSTTGRRTSSGS